MKEVTLAIPGISCQHCVMTIRRESGSVQGVEFVSGDPAAKTATFRITDESAVEGLKKTLSEAGYPVA